MKKIGFALALAACAVLLSTRLAAATGVVTWLNPPRTAGMIERDDDGSMDEYVFLHPADTGGIGLDLGTPVVFDVGPGQSRRARNVRPDDNPAPPRPAPRPNASQPSADGALHQTTRRAV